MKRYMLDTNTLSHLVRGHEAVGQQVESHAMVSLCMSVITEAEIKFGLAKQPKAKRLHTSIHELFKRVDVLPWNSHAADSYAQLRAQLEKQGKTLDSLDMLIAAHALSNDLVLVTNDKAFKHASALTIEDWTV